jgi:uncharacterized protein
MIHRLHTEWPRDVLNVAELRASGAQAQPFRQFILKIHSRCNLSCTYCYVYELADQSWRHRPRIMPPHIVQATVARITEHVRGHRLRHVRVILHGGEPLLAGPGFIADLAAQVRRALPPQTTTDLVIQTNGTLLDEAMLEVVLRAGIRVGVSVDGGRAATDRYRRYPSGGSSHDAVTRALDLLRQDRYRAAYNGLLCVVSLQNDPAETYEALLSHSPPMIDFLLPHGTWSSPPLGRSPDTATPYADWLLEVFSRWVAASRQETSIRLFEAIISQILGGPSTTETIGLAPADSIVIETDGSIRQSDALSVAYEDAAATGLDVTRHALDMALDHPTTVARQLGLAGLSASCHACRIRDICGGGFYPHRYRASDGFRNPSVYCADLMRLITVIRDYVVVEMARLGQLERPHRDRAGLRRHRLQVEVHPTLLGRTEHLWMLLSKARLVLGHGPSLQVGGLVLISGRT